MKLHGVSILMLTEGERGRWRHLSPAEEQSWVQGQNTALCELWVGSHLRPLKPHQSSPNARRKNKCPSEPTLETLCLLRPQVWGLAPLHQEARSEKTSLPISRNLGQAALPCQELQCDLPTANRKVGEGPPFGSARLRLHLGRFSIKQHWFPLFLLPSGELRK